MRFGQQVRCLLVAALFAVAFTVPPAASAQETRARAESQRLMVEVVGDHVGRGSRSEVPERASEEGFTEFNAPRTLAGWVRPKERPSLTSVRLRLSYEGDAVRVRVAAVFDDSHLTEVPGPKFGAREQEVASLLAREGETLTVNGFKKLGAEPLMLKVVRFEPEPEMPLVPAPARATTLLKSVEVVSFTTAGAHLEHGQLTLLNVSLKNIVALEVDIPDYGLSQQTQAAPGRALMEPGATFKTEVSLGRSGRGSGQGFAPEPQPNALVVTAIVFEDGSHEGNTETAAKMAARQRGRLVQFARVLKLLQSALDDSKRHAPAALAMLKVEVAGLRIDAEPSLLDELLAQFPELSGDDGRKLLAEAALNGLRAGREESLRFIEEADAAGVTETVRQLESVREKIEKRAGRRRD